MYVIVSRDLVVAEKCDAEFLCALTDCIAADYQQHEEPDAAVDDEAAIEHALLQAMRAAPVDPDVCVTFALHRLAPTTVLLTVYVSSPRRILDFLESTACYDETVNSDPLFWWEPINYVNGQGAAHPDKIDRTSITARTIVTTFI